ncbi:MAG: helix-turn-helix domain-containing protein [Victivallaceae bacterium]|nr:AraC family transcriptional regulator [Victivallaceae bacterium]
MNNDDILSLKKIAGRLPEPENLFAGRLLPPRFAPPDSILVFHHDYVAAAPNAHGRYTLVVPLCAMTYFVERRKVELEPGMALLVPPHSMRYLSPASAGYGRIFITFELPEPQEYLPDDILCGLSPAGLRLLRRFMFQYRRSDPVAASTALMLLLRSLNDHPVAIAEEHRFPLPVLKAIEFISAHLPEPIGNPEIAEAAGISESHLRGLFRDKVGMTPGRYLAHQRLDAAKHRLLHTSMSIEQISRSCGYSSIYVFSAFFRKQTGISPLRFRRLSENP